MAHLCTGSPVRFSAETSYSAEYPAHVIEPRPAPPALLQHHSGPRFDSVSSYTVRWLVHELRAACPSADTRCAGWYMSCELHAMDFQSPLSSLQILGHQCVCQTKSNWPLPHCNDLLVCKATKLSACTNVAAWLSHPGGLPRARAGGAAPTANAAGPSPASPLGCPDCLPGTASLSLSKLVTPYRRLLVRLVRKFKKLKATTLPCTG